MTLDPKVPLLHSDTPERRKHRRGYCCPPRLARTIAKMHGYAYSVSDDALWIHLYDGNVLDTRLTNGRRLKLLQETQYPWDGEVRLTIETATGERPLGLIGGVARWQKRRSQARPGNYWFRRCRGSITYSLVEFATVNGHIDRSLDSELYATAVNLEYRQQNAALDDYLLADLSRENQHVYHLLAPEPV